MTHCPPHQHFFSKTLSPETPKMKELCERNFCGMSLRHLQMYFARSAFVFRISFLLYKCYHNHIFPSHLFLRLTCILVALCWRPRTKPQFITLWLRNTQLLFRSQSVYRYGDCLYQYFIRTYKCYIFRADNGGSLFLSNTGLHLHTTIQCHKPRYNMKSCPTLIVLL
jgi:hypothetical protein